LGDPETQAVLPLMESDLLDLLNSAINKDLKNYNIEWKKAHSCCVVAASDGYPGEYKTGLPIEIKELTESKVFGAGVAEKDSKLYTSGGRVLAVTSTADTLEQAIEKAYRDIKNVDFEGIYYRKDIGTLY
jgi:phosphoribosylamine-glycine ligase